jgi:hypothetical protein
MNVKIAVKLVLLGALIVAGLCWLRGHDILTGVALVLPLLFVVANVVIAIISRRGGSSSQSGGSRPPISPSPVKRPPRPPGGPPDVYCEHAA